MQRLERVGRRDPANLMANAAQVDERYNASAPTPLAPLLSIKDLANLLGVSESMIRKMVAQGKLPYIRMGSKTGFRVASIEAWLAENEQGGKRRGRETA